MRRRAHISIHALREEGDGHRNLDCGDAAISIHALREEGDSLLALHVRKHVISIHALREEGDFRRFRIHTQPDNFYPRPPRGGRPNKQSCGIIQLKFLSTPSARRATCSDRKRSRSKPISIHALREEGDRIQSGTAPGHHAFLSTPSARRATSKIRRENGPV